MPTALLQLAQPGRWWLIVVLPWLPAVLWHWQGRRASWYGLAIQSLALVLVGFALMGPQLERLGGPRPVAVFVDVSASQRGLPATLSLDLPADPPHEALVFAATLARAAVPVNAAETRLAPVLELIAAGGDRLAAAVIVTDGRATDAPDAIHRAAAAVAERGLPVLFVPRGPSQPDARVTRLAVRRRPEGGAELAVTVASDGPLWTTLHVTRIGLDSPLLTRPMNLAAGDLSTLRIVDAELPAEAPAVYRAELLGPDLLPENNAMAAPAPPAGRAVLWLGPTLGVPMPFGPQVTVRHLSAEEAPREASALLAYDAVIAVDPSGTAFEPAHRAALAEFVRLGGGLVLVGAGPHDTLRDLADPLNAVLPLRVSPYARQPLEVVLALDASGSMAAPAAPGGPPKFDAVRQAAVATVREQLGGDDHLHILTFRGSAELVYGGAVGERAWAQVADALARVAPAGPTRVTAAMEASLAALAPASPEGRRRLVIVLSDLQTEPLDVEAWARRFEQADAAFAVAATGEPRADAPVEQLARRLGAPFVHRESLGGLAEVFAGFVRRARGETLVPGPVPVETLGPLFGLDLAEPPGLPPVGAFLQAAADPQAEVLLRTVEGSPLLARRRADSGRSVAFAIPLATPEGPAWPAPLLGQVLAAAAEWAAAPGGDPRFDGQIVREPGEPARLVIRASEPGGPMNALDLVATVTMVAAPISAAEADLLPVAPGTYAAELPQLGNQAASVTVRGRANGTVVWRGGIPSRYAVEFAAVGVDEGALHALAEQTGGQVVAPEALAEHLRTVAARQRVDLSRWLLAAALALMLADFLLTRVTEGPRRV